MDDIERARVYQMVQRRLGPRQGEFPGYRVHLGPVAEASFREGVWCLPVHPDRDPQRDTPYYDVLADIEEDLQQREGMEVWLVPADIRDPAQPPAPTEPFDMN